MVKKLGFSTLIFLLLFTWDIAVGQPSATRYAQKDMGIPAYPHPIPYRQPDGSVVTVTLKGDGAIRWAEATDGYKLVKDSEGYFCYAMPDAQKGIKASTFRAADVAKRSAATASFLSSISKSIFFTPNQVQNKRNARISKLKSGGEVARAFPTSGNRKLLAILVNFSDVSMKRTKAEFDNLFNQKGYSTSGSTGSVADYFADNSFGKMALTVDVVGPYKVSKPMSYYGGNDSNDQDSYPDVMVSEAIALANKDVDFSQYDNDKDGTIDGVYVIFAGYGEEAGAPANTIWSHAWEIPAVSYDGVKISAYSCSPELFGNVEINPTANITTMGVITHEFLHVCGLPDYYDTDYEQTGGEAPALGEFEVMDAGSWNNDGKTPPYVNSYSRKMLGWGTLDSFTLKSTNTLLPHNASAKGFVASTKANEYFVFENRQKNKWDAYIPGHGMLAYHVVYDKTIWDQNTINANPQKEYFQLVDAKGSTATASSPFPGTANIKSFTTYTTPSFKNWDGSAFNMPLTNIVEQNGNILVDVKKVQYVTFLVSDGTTSIAGAQVAVDGINSLTNTSGSLTAEVSLAGSRSFTVSKQGYQPYTGTFSSENDYQQTVTLYKSVSGQHQLKLTNGTNPIPNVSVKIGATVYTSNLEGVINIPQPSGAVEAELMFNGDNRFTYSFTINPGSSITTLNFRKIVAFYQSRIGEIASIYCQIGSYGNTTLTTGAPQNIYVPSELKTLPYTTTFENGQAFTMEFSTSSNPVDTLKMSFNKYRIYTAQMPNSIPNISIKSSIGYDFTTNDQGFNTLYTPAFLPSISFSVLNDDYYKTTSVLDNQSWNSEQFVIGLVSSKSKQQVTIAPNPCVGTITIYAKDEGSELYLYNARGVLVHQQKLSTGVNYVLSGQAKPGLYIAKIKTGQLVESQKIVVL